MHVRGHGIKSDTRIARPKAPCGTFVVKRAFVPSGAPVGKYRVQFDASKRFSKRASSAPMPRDLAACRVVQWNL